MKMSFHPRVLDLISVDRLVGFSDFLGRYVVETTLMGWAAIAIGTGFSQPVLLTALPIGLLAVSDQSKATQIQRLSLKVKHQQHTITQNVLELRGLERELVTTLVTQQELQTWQKQHQGDLQQFQILEKTLEILSRVNAKPILAFPGIPPQAHADSCRGRVVFLVDCANIERSMKEMSRTKIDYAKLLQLVQAEATNIQAFAYTAQDDYNVANLRQLGYTVITKPKVQQPDNRDKCNVDLEIAFKIIELTFKRTYDTLVLASGDSDFAVALNLIHRARLRVELLSHSEHTSPRLLQLADRYLDLRHLEAEIARPEG